MARDPEVPNPNALKSAAAGLRLIRGANRRADERLNSRDTVIRILIESGVDLLLRRISAARAREIQRAVDEILILFDQVDVSPERIPLLHQQLDSLERLMNDTRALQSLSRG